jgi:hypothetical protein
MRAERQRGADAGLHTRVVDRRPSAELRQAEIHVPHVGGSIPDQEEVSGLQIAMHEASLVGGGEPPGSGLPQLECLAEAQRPLLEAYLQVDPVEPFHHQKSRSSAVVP